MADGLDEVDAFLRFLLGSWQRRAIDGFDLVEYEWRAKVVCFGGRS